MTTGAPTTATRAAPVAPAGAASPRGRSDAVPLRVVLLACGAGALSLQVLLPSVGAAGAVLVSLVQVFAVLVAVIDHREGRIPNRYVIGMLLAVLVAGLSFSSAVSGLLTHAWLVSVGIGVALTVISLMFDGIGMGDVKFLAAASVPLTIASPWAALALIAISAVGVTAQSAIARLRFRSKVERSIPMGPWIAIGIAPAVLLAATLQ